MLKIGGGNLWAWDGTDWQLLPNAAPGSLSWGLIEAGGTLYGVQRVSAFPEDLLEAFRWDPVQQQFVQFTIFPFRDVGSLGRVVEYDGTLGFVSWVGAVYRILSSGPDLVGGGFSEGRREFAAVFDRSRSRLVVVGGGNPTTGNTTHFHLEFDGTSWVPVAAPAALSSQVLFGRRSMIYDSVRGTSLLYAGGTLNPSGELWEYDGTAWTLRDAGLQPSQQLGNSACAYDAARGEIVLFGGFADPAIRDETWVWEGTRWRRQEPALRPPGRMRHEMAYDRHRQRVVVQGGLDSSAGVFYTDTWEWEGSTWADRSPAVAPPVRSGRSAMAYDEARRVTILFGGAGFDGGANVNLDDTWAWDGTSWMELAPAHRPLPRKNHAMAYDAARQRMVLFGGQAQTGPFSRFDVDDTWEWDGTDWIERLPAHHPPAGEHVRMVYDRARSRIVLLSFPVGQPIRVWEWDGVDWTAVGSAGAPLLSGSEGQEARACYDEQRQQILLWARNPNTGLDETWLYTPRPVIVDEPPTADAGPDQSIVHNTTVHLDGGESFDDITATADLLYAWTLTQYPAGSTATLTGDDTQTPSFFADQPGKYVAQLVVTDEGGNASLPDEVEVCSTNLAPTADAGGDQVVVVNRSTSLDGIGSTDPEADPLTFAWTVTAAPTGSAATLVGANTSTPSFTPDLIGAYTIQLVVHDGFVSSEPDDLILTAVTAADLATSKLQEASELLLGFADTDFDAKGHRRSMANMIGKIAGFLARNDLGQAREHLEKLIERTDGVPLRMAVDPKGQNQVHAADFVTDGAAQLLLYDRLTAALSALTP